MQAFVIEGGRPLHGSVRAAGNKNGALPILAATVLATEPVLLSNVPRIRDVQTMVEPLIDVGADAEWLGENEIGSTPSEFTSPSWTRSLAAASAPRSCSQAHCSPASAARRCRHPAAT
jgi:UDP-N-acetylglucosamine 1-carboxyvinyltransferase